jgi:hypothetical protein
MNGTSALIGFTGFVGSTLLREQAFDALFNSQNISEIRGRHFSTVVCAGVSAVKWWANKNPEADKSAIESLRQNIDTIEADHFILISTVDVYPNPVEVTEDDIPDHEQSQPYGRHRRELEIWVDERFDKCTVIRLPGLFGHGLKKNLIFDLIHGNQTSSVSKNGVLQWYPMERFSSDLERIVASGINLVNISPVPLSTQHIKDKLFADALIGTSDEPGPMYDMQTVHPGLLGGSGSYHIGQAAVLDALERFIEKARHE